MKINGGNAPSNAHGVQINKTASHEPVVRLGRKFERQKVSFPIVSFLRNAIISIYMLHRSTDLYHTTGWPKMNEGVLTFYLRYNY